MKSDANAVLRAGGSYAEAAEISGVPVEDVMRNWNKGDQGMWTKSNIHVGASPILMMRFPGGEVNVRLPFDLNIEYVQQCWINAVISNSDDLVTLMLAADALRRAGSRAISLEMPYIPYARQDRVVNSGEALSIAVIARIINQLDFKRVVVFDPHSDVSSALIDRVEVIPVEALIGRIFTDNKWDCVVAPDAGAEKKVAAVARRYEIPMVKCAKKRDPMTGNLSGFAIVDGDVAGRRCLIVDDICDAGGTFVGIASLLRAKRAADIDLFVTHGIFSRGFGPFAGLISNVYFTNSRRQSPGEPFDAINTWKDAQ